MVKETRVGNIIGYAQMMTTEMVIEGYALKFDTWSENLGGFKETISRRALENTDLSDVRCLVDHIPSQIVGGTKSGTGAQKLMMLDLNIVVSYQTQHLHVIYMRTCV